MMIERFFSFKPNIKYRKIRFRNNLNKINADKVILDIRPNRERSLSGVFQALNYAIV
jgi:hypothetical protein